MRVLGIDPGYAIVGYGLVISANRQLTTSAYGCLTTPAHTDFPDRLLEIHNDLGQLIDHLKPDVLSIESLFYTSNQKTAIAVAEARGVILLTARKAGLPIYEYTPLQVKQSVAGYGKATKKQVQEMTKRLLRLSALPKPDDAADALAVGICHANSVKNQIFGKGQSKREKMGYY